MKRKQSKTILVRNVKTLKDFDHIAGTVYRKSSHMFNPIFRKLFWKEYRMFRPFWTSVFVITFAIYLLAYCLSRRGLDIDGILYLSLSMAVLYALGCSASSFSWDLENGTYYRLRSLPVSAWQVAMPKLTWTLVSSVFLTICLIMVGGVFHNSKESLDISRLAIFLSYPFIISISIAWGTVFSTLTRQPVLAAVMAALTTIGTLAISSGALRPQIKINKPDLMVSLFLSEFIVVGFVAIIAFFCVDRWFDYWRFRESNEEGWFPSDSSGDSNYDYGFCSGKVGQLSILMKHHYRQNRLLYRVLLSSFAFVMFVMVVEAVSSRSLASHDGIILMFSWLCFVCTIVASNMFGADNRRSEFRFFAHHGVRPGMIWLSRFLFTGFLFGFLWTCTVFMVWLYDLPEVQHRQLDHFVPAYVFYLLFVLGPMAFVIGGICSMLLKSRLVAWTFSLGLILLSLFLLHFYVGLEICALFLIPTLGLLLGSYFHTSNWIREQIGWRAHLGWITPTMISLIVLGVILTTTQISQAERELFARSKADQQISAQR